MVSGRPDPRNIGYLAPAVRLMKLPDVPRAGTEAGEAVEPDVLGDLLRLEVTRVHTGSAQYSLTLNNWYASTAVERAADYGTREIAGGQRPRWPRYKYNDFQLLRFGQRLRIDMRYWPAPESDASGAKKGSHAWVPLVAGPIVDMQFNFADRGAEVTIKGEDDLSRLKDAHEGRMEFDNQSERDIVSKVLQEAKFPFAKVADSLVEWPAFAKQASKGIAEGLQDGQAYLEYLQKLAERLDFEVFMEFADLDNPDGGQELHFEPARSRAKPTDETTFVLHREQNLISFSPKIKVVEQPSAVIVKGRHRDRNNPEPVKAMAVSKQLADELHIDPAKGDAPLLSGPDFRAKYFSDRSNPQVAPNQTNMDPERAAWLAEVLLRKKAREFFIIDATTIGLPRLRPGQHVEIRGLRQPFDGFFYVTKTVHTYGPDGMRTKITGRRPGMPAPPYSEA